MHDHHTLSSSFSSAGALRPVRCIPHVNGVSKCENLEKELDFYYMFKYMDESWFIMDDLCILSFSSRTKLIYVRESMAD